MSLSIDRHFGVHAEALKLSSQRTQVLATNLANADTPGFQARDIDFRAVMRQFSTDGGLRMTHHRHLDAQGGQAGSASLTLRTPSQPSQDGNTVDVQLEQAAFAENAVRYQASLEFLSSRIRGLLTAIKGQSQ